MAQTLVVTDRRIVGLTDGAILICLRSPLRGVKICLS